LAVIIGNTLVDASAQRGLEGVLGYTVFNDLSGRASQLEAMTLSTSVVDGWCACLHGSHGRD
jgi:2-keto-4-pentenoate hydratase/2-oxohepta-3-ene-1,7-dioic acid hydratase in catechol pathway